ncbi:hypothetical protein G5B37_00165 [Rasiella rasia]|uniref:Uncharacterized protein n=1 Tax=Rasiella rasia TaxID=2744027 RepID=A0A6G6GHI2_9FLAO|nr:hypothetical protein [Rasiella rasia]QIE58035.1 hypothetical protein G5B37_00165 [Rasiella rasia]
MIKDIFLSFRDNFKEKTTNPFLGTYLIIWIIRNWELVYSLFNFDSSDTLEIKVNFIKEYYKNNSFIEGILNNILWTFGVLIITFLLLNISRAIVNLFEKQLKPWIYKLTDSKSVVLKSTYEIIRNERDDLQFRLDKERDSKSRLESRIKTLEGEILERERAVAEKEGEESIESNKKEEPSDLQLVFNKLNALKLIEDFKEMAVASKKGDPISVVHNSVDKYLEYGLLEYKESTYSGDGKYYKVTPEGDKLLRYMRNNI